MENRQKPLHVFIIPDGNRRWAKDKGLAPWEGHKKGYEVFESLVRKVWTLGITHLTVWGLSRDNLYGRSTEEISFLTEIIRTAINNLFSSRETEEEKLCVRVIGRWKELFAKEFTDEIVRLENKTASYYTDKNLTLLLAYNGDEELENTVTNFHRAEPLARIAKWERLKNWSWTWFLPDVDIMIRTGSEPHLSNGALTLLMKNAHLYFPQMHWPEFSIEELAKIIGGFKNREHRFGA